MLEYCTQGFKGHAVKYSPFFDSRIAVASAANFGLVGNGRLYILGLTPDGIVAEKWYVLYFYSPFRTFPLPSPLIPLPSNGLTGNPLAKGSTPKMPSTISPGQSPTRINAS